MSVFMRSAPQALRNFSVGFPFFYKYKWIFPIFNGKMFIVVHPVNSLLCFHLHHKGFSDEPFFFFAALIMLIRVKKRF